MPLQIISGTKLPVEVFQNIHGVIFDFDGTLFDYFRLPLYLILACPWDIKNIYRERVTRKKFAGCDFGSAERYYAEYFAQLSAQCHKPEPAVRAWYFNRFLPALIRVLKKHYKPRPGLQTLFNRFETRDNVSVSIYSDYPVLQERLAALGVRPGGRFRLYGPESFGAQKPAPRPFLTIAKHMGVHPEETIVIGDREETDGIGALRAGMRFFCLETGRKRHFHLDPNRRPLGNEVPSIPMYCGSWDTLSSLLIAFLGG
ncbi:MAG: HAD family hydrolase [Treponema sp.]|nr:HAD family hydrolase [Treponema sp.]